MNSYITWGDLLWVILGLVIGNILAYIGSDLIKLAWQRRKKYRRDARHEQGTGD